MPVKGRKHTSKTGRANLEGNSPGNKTSKAGKVQTHSDRVPEGSKISEHTMLEILQRYPISFWEKVKASYQQGYTLPQKVKEKFPDTEHGGKGCSYTYAKEYGTQGKEDTDKLVDKSLIRQFKENSLPFRKLVDKIQKEIHTRLCSEMYSNYRESFLDQFLKTRGYGVPLTNEDNTNTRLVLNQTPYSDLATKQEMTLYKLQLKTHILTAKCTDNGNVVDCQEYELNAAYSQCGHSKTELKKDVITEYPLSQYWHIVLAQRGEG